MFLKFICILLVLANVAVASLVNVNTEWNAFKNRYGKTYTPLEDKFRFSIYSRNKQRIDENNNLFNEGIVTYLTGINHLSDMLPNEITIPQQTNNKIFEKSIEIDAYNFTLMTKHAIPQAIDYRRQGRVTDVKSQGNSCKASWAFAAIGAVEGQLNKDHSYDKPPSLSAQNLIDCIKNFQCNKEFSPKNALEYIKTTGINTESDYSYSGIKSNCKFKNANYIKIDNFEKINDERTMEIDLYNNGPIAVSINIDDPGFMSYKSGIYRKDNCPHTPNHSLLIVGYGIDREGVKYWIVKNSWGTEWGDAGYIKIIRGENMCGIGLNGMVPKI